MINSRRVGVLLVVAVIVIAGALWWGSRGREQSSAMSGTAVLANLKQNVNAVSEIRVMKGDGMSTTLRKDANAWIVAEREFPADASRVRKLLLDLAALSVIEEKTSDPANYATLGVEDVKDKATGTLIEIDGLKEPAKLIVGKGSGAKSSYVRVAGAKPSLLAAPQLTLEAEPRRWLDRAVVDIPQERIREVAVKPATGPAYIATREKAEQTDFTVKNLPRGAKLSSPSAANSLATALAGLTLDDVRRSAAPAAAAAATDVTVFRTFDGLELEVTGRKEGERRHVTLVARSTAPESAAEAEKIQTRTRGWDFEIPGYKYEAIFRPLSELLDSPD